MESLVHNLMPLAKEAGQLILEVYRRQSFATRRKADHSPVTDADMVSHAFLVSALTKLSPFPVVSEEGDFPDIAFAKAFWLVDPLDGTRDFLDRNDEFSINIALVEGGYPILGVIHAPALGETYYGEKGRGAFRLDGDTPRRLPEARPQKPMLIRSRHHDVPRVSEFQKLNGITNTVSVGSALKFGRLARGSVTVYPRYFPSREWDTAAGHALLKEAGGSLIDLVTGKEPIYGKPGFGNNPFIAGAPGVDLATLKWLKP